VSWKAVVVAIALSACGTKSAEKVELKWLDLQPLPLEIEVPSYATAGQHRESPDRDAPPGMLVSARACVLVVMPGTRGPLDAQQTEVKAEHPDAKIVGLTSDHFEYRYKAADGSMLRSFRFEKMIGGAPYHCEPFTGRGDISCEQRACASLRARAVP
jgi:hypothetical protein